MKRVAFGTVLLGAGLAAAAAFAATSGATTAERGLAVEFRKRLTEKGTTNQKHALALARVYLRRAYRIDIDPARTLALELLDRDLRVKEPDQLRYFGLALDALTRGADLAQVKATIHDVLSANYPAPDKAQFLTWFIGAASQHTSPAPLVTVTATASDNGMTGKRRRDFVAWAVAQVERGENPVHIKRIYDAVRAIAPSFAFQTAFLEKCFAAIRTGAPPAGLTAAVERMTKESEVPRRVDEMLEKVLDLFRSGTPFNEAVQKVLPAAEEPPQ